MGDRIKPLGPGQPELALGPAPLGPSLKYVSGLVSPTVEPGYWLNKFERNGNQVIFGFGREKQCAFSREDVATIKNELAARDIITEEAE